MKMCGLNDPNYNKSFVWSKCDRGYLSRLRDARRGYALRNAHRGAITGGGFLSERHIDPIPITVYHVTAASAIVTRVEDVCLRARDYRALIRDSVARIISPIKCFAKHRLPVTATLQKFRLTPAQ